MGRRTNASRAAVFSRNVFVNCPFDDDYRPLFEAAIFAIFDCSYVPRCALEIDDSAQVRIDKIFRIVEECRFGVHDLSRTELDKSTGLPRFNMPLELGIFLGARRFGGPPHDQKSCLVLDVERFRYQAFISDISGQDIQSHGGDTGQIISKVRNWLSDASRRKTLPGGTTIRKRFQEFQEDLPALCQVLRLDPDDLTFNDYTNIVVQWLRQRTGRPS